MSVGCTFRCLRRIAWPTSLHWALSSSDRISMRDNLLAILSRGMDSWATEPNREIRAALPNVRP